MSMLAERKIKQKWSLNPRGKAWSEDSNKFGQKLLEKMGWSKGKGLGAREDGIVDSLKVSYKNDSKGMGFKDRTDQWTEHDANFNALLETLSGKKIEENEIKVSSLEEKSQSSRVRVHYKKFTRGKDLSKWSEKDLANIFGKKSLKEDNKEEKREEKSEENVENEHSFVRNSGSMVDYFKKKLPNFGKNNGYVVGTNGVLKKNEDSEEETYVGFGFKSEEKVDFEEEGLGKKRKLNGISKIEEEEIPKKKKKKKFEESFPTTTIKEEMIGLSNPAFDPFLNNVEVSKHVLNTIQEEEESFKTTSAEVDETPKEVKKKKKKDKDSSLDLDVDIQNISSNDTFEVKRKNKKKVNGLDNSCFDDNIEESGCQNSKFEIKKKKKQERDGFDNSNFDDNVEENSCQNNKFEVKKKKKENSGLVNPNFDINTEESGCQNNKFEIKKKKKQERDGFDNPNFDDNVEENSCQNNKFEVKKKKKENSGLVNPNFDINTEESGCQNNKFEIKKKKKVANLQENNYQNNKKKKKENFEENGCQNKKKKKQEKDGLDNPNFDDNVEETTCPNFEESSSQNNDYEVRRKKKRKSEDDSFAVDNPVFDSSNDCQNSYVDSNYEVKRKKKKKNEDTLALDNPVFDSQTSIDVPNEPSFDLILNVTSTPSVPKPESVKKSSVKRRKSVRFSDVNEERIIPSNEDIKNRNELFDINSRIIENGLKDGTNLDLDENIDEISKKIDGFQSEIENEINEAKVSQFIGEVGNPDGENEKLPDGTRLKFKYANFGRTPAYMNKNTSKAKKSYKHLIKGDIILGFRNTNLHEIEGYAVVNKQINK